MRLLDTHTLTFVNNESKLKKIDNGGGNMARQWGYARPYAILSHTWEKGEITFEQVQRDPPKLKSKKILGACEQARRDGEDYIWIDSCCIDKSSSAELSEAINSMFDWYQKSRRCYIYLSDVQKDVGSIADSRWFRRSWTLQELVAPRDFEIFDRDWQSIGTTQTHLEQMSQITGIDKFAFGYDLSTFSIATRMSWAADREATKPEDIAYSLLGLFDINIPLLYGEGEAKAFRRLQQEILKNSPDQSIFAWNFDPKASIPTKTPDLPMQAQQGCHLLAVSPDQFKNSKNISSDHEYESTRSNGSLEIPMPTFPLSDQAYVSLLACYYKEKDQKFCIAIVVMPPQDNTKYHTRCHIPAAAATATTTVPAAWFLSTEIRTISLEPFPRSRWKPKFEEYRRDQWYLKLLFDEREYQIRSVRPPNYHILDETITNVDQRGKIYHITDGLPQRSEFSFRSMRDNADLTVSVEKTQDSDRSRLWSRWALEINHTRLDMIQDQNDGHPPVEFNNILWSSNYVEMDGKEAWYRFPRTDDSETVAILSHSRWLDKGFWILKIADFKKSSSGWQNHHNLFAYPCEDLELEASHMPASSASSDSELESPLRKPLEGDAITRDFVHTGRHTVDRELAEIVDLRFTHADVESWKIFHGQQLRGRNPLFQVLFIRKRQTSRCQPKHDISIERPFLDKGKTMMRTVLLDVSV